MNQQQLAFTAEGHSVARVSPSRGRGPRFRTVGANFTVRPAFTLPGLEFAVIPNTPKLRDNLRRFFSDQRIDVVHVQTEFGLAHAAADVAAELGIPVIHTVHTFYWASDDRWTGFLAPILRVALRRVTGAEVPRRTITPRPVDNLLRNVVLAMAARADAVISPSAHQGRDLQAQGLRTAITIIPNPIATSPRAPVPLPELSAPPRFLWVARCEGVKRPLPFAEAAIRALARTGNGFSVDFVGDGSERVALQRLVAGHPTLRVQGGLPHDDVLDLMDAASAVVLTSVGFDNQPMTIAEAVSRERGILYCDPKLREGLLHAGYLARSPDVAGLADAIVALVEQPTLFQSLSEGAAQDGAQFSPGTYVEHFTALYGEVRARVS